MNDSPGRPVHAWVTGQQSNIGDSLLRRPYVRLLETLGPVDLWVRDAGPDFLSGVDARDTTRLSRSFLAWWLRALLDAARRPTVVAINAGEVPAGRATAVAAAAFRVLVGVCRRRGGTSLWLGGSVPDGRDSRSRASLLALARHVSVVTWRERRSLAWAQVGDVQPDWAFAEGTPTDQWTRDDRRCLAIVLRGDRTPPPQEWTDWIAHVAKEHRLDVVTVVQVQRDRELAHRLAETVGGTCLDWPDGTDHATQERRVRDLYRRSRLTVGDRLHGLVMAATEGSIPLGWVPSSGGKIGAHFEVVDLPWVGDHEGSRFVDRPDLSPRLLESCASDLVSQVDRSRACLHALADTVHATLAPHRPKDLP